MHPVVGWIHGRLSRPITVDVSPARFSFTRTRHTVRLDTKVYISTVDGKVIAVGTNIPTTEPFEEVSLFEPRPCRTGHSKGEVLRAFMAYGFVACSEGLFRRLLRPVVEFRGSEALASVTAGYQEDILTAAAMGSGALRCKFAR